MKDMTENMRSPMARARGLGSAHEGTHHWWGMKVTAVALVIFGLWLMYSLTTLAGFDQASAADWIKKPANALVLLLFILFGLHHGSNGLQVIIEDYVQNKPIKTGMTVVKIILFLAAAVKASYSILYLALKA